ncbi:hypothetical protein LOK49_LG05G03041 [Camellia lanceoleosa]|uniref:Uncharacterized protein n=1 Tax=Camellia lanceoleosa TaxID=1840588 RepID=A0ACC0HN66_9ERIC|nr:hypothetical protein LOK49_LG05G03041 [Camellia lanceoleosa]
MKGVALDPSSYGGFGDSKARIKHQSLLQDYQDLQKRKQLLCKSIFSLDLVPKLNSVRERYMTKMAVPICNRRHSGCQFDSRSISSSKSIRYKIEGQITLVRRFSLAVGFIRFPIKLQRVLRESQ